MKKLKLDRLNKLLLMATLMALVLVPVASQAMSLSELDHGCVESIEQEISGQDEETQPSHNQHAHHCGHCHSHIFFQIAAPLLNRAYFNDSSLRVASLRVPSPIVYGLFRPPRG